MEQIERVFLQLADIIDTTQLERAINISAIPSPTGEVTPAFLVSSIIPAVGSTVVDYPTINTAPLLPPPRSREFFRIVCGFDVRVEGDVVSVGAGVYIKNGEERKFGGAQLQARKFSLVVFNIETERVEVVDYRLPQHVVLKEVL